MKDFFDLQKSLQKKNREIRFRKPRHAKSSAIRKKKRTFRKIRCRTIKFGNEYLRPNFLLFRFRFHIRVKSEEIGNDNYWQRIFFQLVFLSK